MKNLYKSSDKTNDITVMKNKLKEHLRDLKSGGGGGVLNFLKNKFKKSDTKPLLKGTENRENSNSGNPPDEVVTDYTQNPMNSDRKLDTILESNESDNESNESDNESNESDNESNDNDQPSSSTISQPKDGFFSGIQKKVSTGMQKVSTGIRNNIIPQKKTQTFVQSSPTNINNPMLSTTPTTPMDKYYENSKNLLQQMENYYREIFYIPSDIEKNRNIIEKMYTDYTLYLNDGMKSKYNKYTKIVEKYANIRKKRWFGNKQKKGLFGGDDGEEFKAEYYKINEYFNNLLEVEMYTVRYGIPIKLLIAKYKEDAKKKKSPDYIYKSTLFSNAFSKLDIGSDKQPLPSQILKEVNGVEYPNNYSIKIDSVIQQIQNKRTMIQMFHFQTLAFQEMNDMLLSSKKEEEKEHKEDDILGPFQKTATINIGEIAEEKEEKEEPKVKDDIVGPFQNTAIKHISTIAEPKKEKTKDTVVAQFKNTAITNIGEIKSPAKIPKDIMDEFVKVAISILQDMISASATNATPPPVATTTVTNGVTTVTNGATTNGATTATNGATTPQVVIDPVLKKKLLVTIENRIEKGKDIKDTLPQYGVFFENNNEIQVYKDNDKLEAKK